MGDLFDLYAYIASRDGAGRAIGYIDRIESFCQSLSTFPERGISRRDLRPGLRVVGFERRGVIAFQIGDDVVTVQRILCGGRSLEESFS